MKIYQNFKWFPQRAPKSATMGAFFNGGLTNGKKLRDFNRYQHRQWTLKKKSEDISTKKVAFSQMRAPPTSPGLPLYHRRKRASGASRSRGRARPVDARARARARALSINENKTLWKSSYSHPQMNLSFFPLSARFQTAFKKRPHSSAFGCPLGKSLENLRNFHDFESLS